MDTIQLEKRLLKKWRWILTRYINLQNNNWITIKVRWNSRFIKDHSLSIDYYLREIEKAKKIILKFTK